MDKFQTVKIRSTRRSKIASTDGSRTQARQRLTVVTRAIGTSVVFACIAAAAAEAARNMGFAIQVSTALVCISGALVGILVGARSGWLQERRVVRMEEAAEKFGMKPIGGTRWIRDDLRELYGLTSDVWETGVENAFVKDFGRAKYAVCDFRRCRHGLFQRDKRSRLRTVAIFRFEDGTTFPSFRLRCLSPFNRRLGPASSKESQEGDKGRYVFQGPDDVKQMFTTEFYQAVADCSKWDLQTHGAVIAVSWKDKIVSAKDMENFFPSAFRLCTLAMACTARKPSKRGT